MCKLYENFNIFHFQKRIVSVETIQGNTALLLAPQDLKNKLWCCNDMHVISVSITTNIMIAIGIPL